MKTYCVVSIDTECDQGSQWQSIVPMRFTSVIDLIPNIYQKIFQKYGVKPTYLLSPEVIEDKNCVNVLKSLAHVELGSHLHGEFVEPYKKPIGQKISDFQAMYPPDVERAKLTNLTRMFEASFGYRPTSFRAGRWGISPDTFKILDDLGYWVDSSVTPNYIWKFPNYELNYKTAQDKPYFTSPDNILITGNMRLLQVPVTIVSHWGHCVNAIGPFVPRFLRELLLQIPLWRPKWLRPTYGDFNAMKHVIDTYISTHRRDEDIILNMMFHNVEINPYANPYNFNQERIDVFLKSMKQTFDYLQKKKVQFIGLSDVHGIYRKDKSCDLGCLG